MFREIKRNRKQVLSEEKCIEILNKCTSGVLSVYGDNDYPYGVPLSYAYDDNKLYFHGTSAGHKIDSIKKHDKVCFTVIDTDQVVPKEYTTYFRSVIVFGKVHIVEALDEKEEILDKLVDKYSNEFKAGSVVEIKRSLKSIGIFYIDIDFMSGKEAIEFARARETNI